MLLSSLSRGFFVEKFLNQNAHYETKSFTKLITEYLLKFEKFQVKIKMDLHMLENLSLQTLRYCRLGQVLKRNWFNYNIIGLHAMCVLKNSYVNF